MTNVLRAVAPGVWIDTAPVRFLGLRLTSNMSVLALPDGGVLVHSPVALTPERAEITGGEPQRELLALLA